MVNPVQVPMFTPVVEKEDQTSISRIAAEYLSPMWCNNEIAVIMPGAADADGNKACERKELNASLAMTVLKIVSYFTLILPLLATLVVLIDRCGTKYQYHVAPPIRLPDPAAVPQPVQTPPAPQVAGTPNGAQPTPPQPVLVAPAPQAAGTQTAPPQPIQAAPAPQPAGAQPVPTPPAAGTFDEAEVKGFLGMGMTIQQLEGQRKGLPAAQQLSLDEAIRRLRNLGAQPNAQVQTAAGVPDQAMVKSFMTMGLSVEDLRGQKAGLSTIQQLAIDEAIRLTIQAQTASAAAAANLLPAPAQPIAQAPQAAAPAAPKTAVQKKLEELQELQATIPNMDAEKLRAVFKERLDARDSMAPGGLLQAYDQNLDLMVARAKELGIDVNDADEVALLKQGLKEYEKIKDDIKRVNAAFLAEIYASKKDKNVPAITEARLANLQALLGYAKALGYETLPIKVEEEKPAAIAPAPAQPTVTLTPEEKAARAGAFEKLVKKSKESGSDSEDATPPVAGSASRPITPPTVANVAAPVQPAIGLSDDEVREIYGKARTKYLNEILRLLPLTFQQGQEAYKVAVISLRNSLSPPLTYDVLFPKPTLSADAAKLPSEDLDMKRVQYIKNVQDIKSMKLKQTMGVEAYKTSIDRLKKTLGVSFDDLFAKPNIETLKQLLENTPLAQAPAIEEAPAASAAATAPAVEGTPIRKPTFAGSRKLPTQKAFTADTAPAVQPAASAPAPTAARVETAQQKKLRELQEASAAHDEKKKAAASTQPVTVPVETPAEIKRKEVAELRAVVDLMKAANESKKNAAKTKTADDVD